MGNVQWVHKHVNSMKNNYKQEYFLDMCKKITENNKETKEQTAAKSNKQLVLGCLICGKTISNIPCDECEL